MAPEVYQVTIKDYWEKVALIHSMNGHWGFEALTKDELPFTSEIWEQLLAMEGGLA